MSQDRLAGVKRKANSDDVDFCFLKSAIQDIKKISRKRRNLTFQGTLFHFISTLLDERTSEDHSSGALIYLNIPTKNLHYYKPVQHTKGDPFKKCYLPQEADGLKVDVIKYKHRHLR
jgi:hypothetical protein